MQQQHPPPPSPPQRGAGKQPKKKVCSTLGCSNAVNARGLCSTHYRKPCSIEGCTTRAHAKGLCGKHGAYGECRRADCTTNATKKAGSCTKHRVVKLACTTPGCTSAQISRKLVCMKHGAYGSCTETGCTRHAKDLKGAQGQHTHQ